MTTQRVTVVAGRGKWAYWHLDRNAVVADEVYQPNAAHFAGQLGQAVVNTPCEAELHIEGYAPQQNKSIWLREVESEQYAEE